MTIDEAIKEYQKVIEVQEKLYEDASTNESKEIIKSSIDNDCQLAEWLKELKELREIIDACNILVADAFAVVRLCKELKEAKRLLKVAVEDIRHCMYFYDPYEVFSFLGKDGKCSAIDDDCKRKI